MKITLLIIGLIVVVTIILIKFRKSKPENENTSRPPDETLPKQLKQNDKLVIVKNAYYSDLKKVVIGFCNMYNNEAYIALPRIIKLAERDFAITFPYDIDFEFFCFFVNYLKYPMDISWTAETIGWTTIKQDEGRVAKDAFNKKVMLFVPDDDTDGDNVYFTTADNIGFKHGFAVREGKQILETPKKLFLKPQIDITELADKEFEDFK